MRYGVVAVLASLLIAGLSAGPASAARERYAGDPTIRVLSNRADLISGDEALVQITVPRGVSSRRIKVHLHGRGGTFSEGRDVTSQFAVRPDGRYVGLLEGLRLGENVLTARTTRNRGHRITLTNHPIGGPVLNGPQIQPWGCFSGALDKQCNRQPRYEFFYKSTGDLPQASLRSYNPDNPPSDVATTTTDQGKTVPYIVRQEIGAIDRDEYRVAVLYDPKKPWAPWAPQDGFNRKLVITHGASCDTHYQQAAAPSVLNQTALSRGFAVMSHALDNSGHNCNVLVQAEALMMTKEYVEENYGEIRYTIGSGCSGGALAQQWVANAYPGIYQGITPACSFADAWSSSMLYVDYLLMRRYFENPSRWGVGVVWGPDDITAVEGHPNPINAVTFTTVIPYSGEPTRSCNGVPQDQVYNENTNPRGVRCTLTDYTVNIFGRRPPSQWGPVEQQIGQGFASPPWDNSAVEYGRKALANGTITPAQFVDLNTKIGSNDIDGNPSPARADADRLAVERAYRSGSINQGTNLDEVAIIDLRGPDPGAFHDVYRTYVVRARLEREHGTAANQVLWRGQVPLVGDDTFEDDSIVAMDRWLAAVEADGRRIPLAQKIREDKPASVADRCTNGAGGELPKEECDAVVQSYSSARIEAGMPLTDDTMKCDRKPMQRSDYPVQFSDAQWAELQKAFPDGVCDYSKPGISRVRTVPWLTYKGGPGGRPLGKAPESEPFGCLARRSPIGPRNVGRIRLGLTRRQLLGRGLRVPGPLVRSRRVWRWCVSGGKGSVAAVFNRRGRVALVTTTAPRHGNRRIRPGSRVRRLRAAYPRRRSVGRGLFRASPRSPRLLGVRRGRVRYIAVASRRTIRNRRALRSYLRQAGVVPKARRKKKRR